MTTRHRGRVLRRVLLGIVVLAVLGIAAFLWWARPMALLPEATAALASTAEVTVQEADDGTLTFVPTGVTPTTGLVLYPGGRVPPAAYAPAARAIASAGHLVVIVDVPFHLAVFDIDAATDAIGDHPDIDAWAVGGHSLGGSMAAQYIDSHPATVAGLVLWASYSASDLADDAVRAVTSFGTLDQGAARMSSDESIRLLGTDVRIDPIDGGNHEQMGWYTGQPDDPPATIDRQAQQDRIVAATTRLLDELGG